MPRGYPIPVDIIRRVQDLRRLFPFIRPYSQLLVLAFVLLAVTSAVETGIVLLLGPLFNQWAGIPLGPEGGFVDKFAFLRDLLGIGEDNFTRIAVALVIFSFLKGVFLYFAEYSMSYTGQRVVADLRKRLYGHLLGQSLSFFALNPTGRLMSRLVVDTERLQLMVSRMLTDLMRQVSLFVCFLILMIYIDWLLSLFAFVVAPLVVALALTLGRRVRRAGQESQENLEEMSHLLQETIAGHRTVKAFCMEEYEAGRFRELNRLQVRVNVQAARIGALGSPVTELIGYVSFVPFLLYAHSQIQQGFSLGAFVVFIVALFRLYEPVRKLSRMHLHFQHGFAASTRIFQLLDTRQEVARVPDAPPLALLSREIRFEDVTFTYEDGATAALQDIDLSIRQGEVVALVGPSGAGKTTLASLIPRFLDVSRGRVAIDGTDIRQVDLDSLRDQVAMVTQEVFLFNDTVRDNIGYGRENCSREEIEEAARAAFIHDVVTALPSGYETDIGEWGEKLSGGQRQRLAIARAILKQAPILILDEATSALDSESERLVQEALDHLMANCTTLVIAHRLSTIQRADRIVVMDSGRIVEQGDHRTLLKTSGLYRRLYQLQFSAPGVGGND